MSKRGKSVNIENRLVVVWVLGCKQEMAANGHEVAFGGGMGNVLKLDRGDGCTAVNVLKIIELYT